MKLIVKLKNTHLILLFLSLCIFFPISIANNETLAKNNNSKGFANSNYETREFTNTNDNENNKKFIFVASSKEGNSFKYDNHTNNKFDDLNKKIPENPVSVQNQVPKKSNYNTVFDEKKIVDLIQNVIRNNEKNNIRTEKSKIIEDLKILNHPKSLNSILTESSIKNLDKEILTDLISHENLLKNQYNKKEIPSEFDNLLSNDHSMYSQTNDISQLPQSYIKNKPFVDIVQQNPTNSQMNFNSHYKGDYLKNENHNDSTSNKIMSHNKITKYLYKQNPVNDYQYINRIPSEDEGIKEIYALPKNNIYIKQIPSNTQEINNYNLNSDFENHSPLSKRFLGQDCPCEKLIRCRPCEFNMVNSLGKFLAENPLNIITDKDCPCARKKICPPCAPASVIHDIALRKAQEDLNTFLQIKAINDNLSMKAEEMQRFAQQTEEIEKQALSIANKLNESNTKSFLAKNKMIELNEKARKIALSIDSPKRKFFPCDGVRYPCDEITNSVGEDLINIDNSSAFEINSDYFDNPALKNYKATNEDFLYSKTHYPYYDGKPIVGKSLSPDIISNDSFYSEFSQPNKPSRRYVFDKEKSVKSEVIDIEEFDYERDLNEDSLKPRERISSNIRKVDIDKKDRRN